MKTDMNPSVICALFCTKKGYDEFIKNVDNRKGMRVRELKFVDIGIPLDENFDDNINFLKGGSMPILRRFFEFKLPFGLNEKIFKSLKLKPFDYSKIWKHDVKNPMLFAGLTPIAIDDKYAENPNAEYTDDEKEKAKRLLSWNTPNYKPDDSAVAKNQNDVGEWENKE